MKLILLCILLFILAVPGHSQPMEVPPEHPLRRVTFGIGYNSLQAGNFNSGTPQWHQGDPLEYLTYHFPNMQLSFAYQPENRIFTIRASYNRSEMLQLVQYASQDSSFRGFLNSPKTEIWEIAALYGHTITSKLTHASFSGGISVASITRLIEGAYYAGGEYGGGYLSSDPENDFYYRSSLGAGIVAEVQGMITPFPFLGIGASLYGSLNTVQPYLAAQFLVQLGRLN